MKLKKFLALALALCLTMSMASPAFAESRVDSTVVSDAVETVGVTDAEGNDVGGSVTLPHHEHVLLEADGDADEYQWQIQAYGVVWVDISGADSRELSLCYAMVASLLEDDQAVIRCRAITDGTAAYSGKITVTDLAAGTYYVKELGHTDSTINAKYYCASTNPQKVTVPADSTGRAPCRERV